MMNASKKYATMTLALVLAASHTTPADTVELRNGKSVAGNYVGGTAETVRIETSAGVQSIATRDIRTITFEPPAPPVPKTPPAPKVVQVVPAPAGSLLTVRVETQVSSNDPPGKKFTGKLAADVTSANTVILKAGTTVHGQVDKAEQAGRLAGKSKLALTLTGIESGGKIHPVLTTDFTEAGSSSFKKTARNAAVGGVIGHAVDDDSGAGTGAAVGVGVSLIRKGDSVTVPPGALLEFRLLQPFQIVP